MAALRSTVTKWTPGIGAMYPVVMPMPFSNQCCGNQIHWIWVPIQGYAINFVFGYGSEFGSRMLLNTDPKRIRIHNTVSNWLRASAFHPAFIWACMFQAHHHAKFNLSFKAHLLPPPSANPYSWCDYTVCILRWNLSSSHMETLLLSARTYTADGVLEPLVFLSNVGSVGYTEGIKMRFCILQFVPMYCR